MKKVMQEFFARPGINKSGICQEAGVAQQYLNRILNTEHPITEKFISKLIPVMEKYGFQPPERQAEKKKETASGKLKSKK